MDFLFFRLYGSRHRPHKIFFSFSIYDFIYTRHLYLKSKYLFSDF